MQDILGRLDTTNKGAVTSCGWAVESSRQRPGPAEPFHHLRSQAGPHRQLQQVELMAANRLQVVVAPCGSLPCAEAPMADSCDIAAGDL